MRLQHFGGDTRDVAEGVYDMRADFTQARNFTDVRAAPTFDDRSSVAEARAAFGGFTTDVSNQGFGEAARFNQRGGGFLLRRADLAEKDDRLGLWISLKAAQNLGVRQADNGVAADMNECRCADARLRQIVGNAGGNAAAAA